MSFRFYPVFENITLKVSQMTSYTDILIFFDGPMQSIKNKLYSTYVLVRHNSFLKIPQDNRKNIRKGRGSQCSFHRFDMGLNHTDFHLLQ